MRLFLQVYADCPDAPAAAQLEARLLAALGAWHPSPDAVPARYWKIESLFGFSFRLEPATAASLRAIHALAPAGWTDTEADGEASCVWNRAPGTTFLDPAVAWAELGLVR